MLTIEEVAAIMDGVVEGDERDRLNQSGLRDQCTLERIVVAFPYSDDGLCMVGAVDDEFGAWNGTTLYLMANGNWIADDIMRRYNDEVVEEYRVPKLDPTSMPTVEAAWNDDGNTPWTLKTSLPSASFKVMAYEGDEVFGNGIVFKLP